MPSNNKDNYKSDYPSHLLGLSILAGPVAIIFRFVKERQYKKIDLLQAGFIFLLYSIWLFSERNSLSGLLGLNMIVVFLWSFPSLVSVMRVPSHSFKRILMGCTISLFLLVSSLASWLSAFHDGLFGATIFNNASGLEQLFKEILDFPVPALAIVSLSTIAVSTFLSNFLAKR